MELISQRVALGLPINPKERKRGKSPATASQSRLNLNDEYIADSDSSEASKSQVDVDKWVGRFVEAKSWTGGMKGMFKEGKVRVGLFPVV